MTDRELTADEMIRAAQFLHGAASEAERVHQTSVVLPTRTAKALARAILGALNAH
jgi:hypothetical protein